MILIVLLMVMMMSGLAVFAAQNATFEARSVGGARQLQHLRRSGDSFVVAVASYLGANYVQGKGLVERADTRWTANLGGEENDFRALYNLPTYAGDTSLRQVRREIFGGTSYPLGTATVEQDNADTGVVTPFVFDGVALLEEYKMPSVAGQGMGLNSSMASGMETSRVCVTAYTRLRVPKDTRRAGELRQMHESLGITRAYFELR